MTTIVVVLKNVAFLPHSSLELPKLILVKTATLIKGKPIFYFLLSVQQNMLLDGNAKIEYVAALIKSKQQLILGNLVATLDLWQNHQF